MSKLESSVKSILQEALDLPFDHVQDTQVLAHYGRYLTECQTDYVAFVPRDGDWWFLNASENDDGEPVMFTSCEMQVCEQDEEFGVEVIIARVELYACAIPKRRHLSRNRKRSSEFLGYVRRCNPGLNPIPTRQNGVVGLLEPAGVLVLTCIKVLEERPDGSTYWRTEELYYSEEA